MEAIISTANTRYKVDLSQPIDISIPLQEGHTPIAFGAPEYQHKPLRDGDFTGSLLKGSPVNFYNIHINPHGNGTHTESMLHIDSRGASINRTLKQTHFIARVVSVQPHTIENGDSVVAPEDLEPALKDKGSFEALVIRTLPNGEEKKERNYTGTNPTYLTGPCMELVNSYGIQHLLVDLPSVDRERDGGALTAHKIFWRTQSRPEVNKTITEMIYVDKEVRDGLYLLNIQIMPVEGDASPSRPALYKLEKVEVLE